MCGASPPAALQRCCTAPAAVPPLLPTSTSARTLRSSTYGGAVAMTPCIDAGACGCHWWVTVVAATTDDSGDTDLFAMNIT